MIYHLKSGSSHYRGESDYWHWCQNTDTSRPTGPKSAKDPHGNIPNLLVGFRLPRISYSKIGITLACKRLVFQTHNSPAPTPHHILFLILFIASSKMYIAPCDEYMRLIYFCVCVMTRRQSAIRNRVFWILLL